MRRTFETTLHKVSEQLGQRMAGSLWAGAVARLLFTILRPERPTMAIHAHRTKNFACVCGIS
jgi:hypothetical protein